MRALTQTSSPDTAPSPVEMSAVGRGYLVRYRVMAYTTAVLLIVLVFVGLPLQFAAHRPEVVNVVGTVHGFLYLIYLAVAFQLTRRLAVPKGKMALVLLAGTVPVCRVRRRAEAGPRRFEARGEQADPSPGGADGAESNRARTARVRQRWFSRRALTFHLEVLIIAPACVLAGWWQATRALAGNGLSWAYSVEWPVFALLTIAGRWKLIHEDPEVYRARKCGAPAGDGAGAGGIVTTEASVTVDAGTARLAKRLLSLVGVEFGLGIVALIFVPYGRPSGWQPVKGEPILLAHSILGLPSRCRDVRGGAPCPCLEIVSHPSAVRLDRCRRRGGRRFGRAADGGAFVAARRHGAHAGRARGGRLRLLVPHVGEVRHLRRDPGVRGQLTAYGVALCGLAYRMCNMIAPQAIAA